MLSHQSLIDISLTPVDQLHAATALYTSTHVVDQLLDRLPWPNEPGNLLDPAAGDGSFILRALERLAPNITPTTIRRIQGCEIHTGAADEARSRITSFLLNHGFNFSNARNEANRMIVNRLCLKSGVIWRVLRQTAFLPQKSQRPQSRKTLSEASRIHNDKTLAS